LVPTSLGVLAEATAYAAAATGAGGFMEWWEKVSVGQNNKKLSYEHGIILSKVKRKRRQ
jgi:hypothetical protein